MCVCVIMCEMRIEFLNISVILIASGFTRSTAPSS